MIRGLGSVDPDVEDVDVEATLTDQERKQRLDDLTALIDMIRPAVQQDGGDLVLVEADVEKGNVEVMLQGSCSSCAISTTTLQAGVERILTDRLPWVTEVRASFDELFVALDRFNEQWVSAASFLSPAVVIELLRLSGEWTHLFYGTVDVDGPGEVVAWIGPDPQPYWMLAAREYWERWIHQQQIRRAVGRPGLDDAGFVVPAVAVAMRGFPQGLAAFPAPPGTAVTVALADADAAWTVGCDGETWTLYDGAPDAPTVTFSIDLKTAALVFSRALSNAELTERLHPEGDPDLGAVIVAGIAAFFARG